MLELAIKARIPIIRARTSDLLNLPAVLETIAPDMDITEVTAASGLSTRGGHNLIYAVDTFDVQRNTFDLMVQTGRVLVLINQGEESPFAFNAGEVPVPKALMEDVLSTVVGKKQMAEFLSAFNGLTIKQAAEVVRLVTAKEKSLTVKGVTAMRAQLAGTLQGLREVDIAPALYLPPDDLVRWIKINKPYFISPVDQRLIPRGILLNGPPGVGKSEGAKFIAREFGVPLYRLDLSAALSKWIGESEGAFSRLLTTLDSEAPAVFLVDEVEKLFAETEDQGVTARLLSQILWWLADHKSRVLTVMTTNGVDNLPRELYRARRIDTTLTISLLDLKQGMELASRVLGDFLKPTAKQTSKLGSAVRYMYNEEAPYRSHAEIVQRVYDLVKEEGWLTNN